MVEQETREFERVPIAAGQPCVCEIEQRLAVQRAAFARARAGIRREPTLRCAQIAGHRRRIHVGVADLRPPSQHACRADAITAPSGRTYDDVDALRMRTPRERQVIERVAQRAPAGKSVFARQRQLDIAQPGYTGRAR